MQRLKFIRAEIRYQALGQLLPVSVSVVRRQQADGGSDASTNCHVAPGVIAMVVAIAAVRSIASVSVIVVIGIAVRSVIGIDVELC
jgi:hypothetical protein